MPEFINRFFNGMTSDMNIVMQPEGTWRYAKNVDVITQDGKNFSFKDAMGNTICWTINTPYGATINDDADFPMPIGFISFPDKLVVFSTNNQGTGGYLEIGLLQFKPYGNGIQPNGQAGQYNAGYIPLYHHEDLRATWKHRIEGFGFVENELVQRVYWTDNYNQPRVFNIMDPIYTTYIASGSIVNGTAYMIVEGAIEYPVGSGTFYGPGLPNTNLFVGGATATYTDLTTPTPTAKVIVYTPYQLLDFTPERKLGNIQFYSYGASGSVYCGNKIYFYRLGTNQGLTTTWSYGSSPVHVGDENDAAYLTALPYHNFVGNGTDTVLANSGRSVNVQVENIDTNFDYLELACAEFDQSSTIFRQITIVNKVTITGVTMVVAHTGGQNFGELTLSDVTLFPASILTAKTITTNKNYMFLANTTERQEFSDDLLDLSSLTAASFEYPMPVHNEAESCSLGGMVYDTMAPDTTANPAAGTIVPWSRYYVYDAPNAGNRVEYPVASGTFYNTGDVFVGVVGSTTATFTGTAQARPCVTRNRYTPFGTSDRVENAILIQDNGTGVGYWDYKDPTVHHHCTGYWSEEVYRYALVIYDLKGNPFYARHMIDYTFPSVNDKGGIIRNDDFGGNDIYSLNPSGIKFGNIVIAPALANNISGFSIMRAVRDPRIVTQGLVTQCYTDGASPETVHPGAWIPVVNSTGGTPKEKYYTFLCPDRLVDVPLKAPFGMIGDKMEEAFWVDPFDYGGGVVQRGEGIVAGAEQIYSKMILDLPTDNTTRIEEITYFGDVEEGDSLTGIDSAGTIFTNNMQTAAASNVEGGCVAGAVDYTLNNHSSVGCKKSMFILENDFLHYGPSANGYTSAAASSQMEKIVMNYTKTGVDASTLYGGTSDQALANTLYISTGHYQPITAQVLADTFDGLNFTFNDVEVFGGDCFTCLVDIGYSTYDITVAPSLSYAWTFPCECNANYGLRRGRKTSNITMFYTGTAATGTISYDDGTADPFRPEDYSYNPGYSAEGGLIVYPALPVNYINAGTFQARIRWAGQKILGEIIDSFRTFSLLDSKDISAQSGRINNLKVINDTVFVLQDLAVNTVPVLERQVVSSETGDATTIGTGGVVTRWDVISSEFGNQHQWSVIETEYGLAWFDMIKKAFLVVTRGSGVLEVSQVMGLKGFFDEVFVEAIGSDVITTTNLLNSPTLAETEDQPLMGIGITGVYNPKLKMTYMTFKFKGRKVIAAGNAYINKDFTIGYYHSNTGQFFVGFYDWTPSIAHNHNQIVISANNPKNTTQYLATNIANVSFVVGETLQGQTNVPAYTNAEYICIQNVTLDAAAKYPLGASGSTYWAKVSDTSQVWVHCNPSLTALLATAPDYVYDSFFGKVVDNEYDIVVNPQVGESFFVRAMEQHGPTNVNATSIYTEGSLLSASDVSIRPTDNNYEFVFNKIESNLPLTTLGQRIIDEFLKIKFYKKNYTTSPGIVTGSVKVLRFVKSFFGIMK